MGKSSFQKKKRRFFPLSLPFFHFSLFLQFCREPKPASPLGSSLPSAKRAARPALHPQAQCAPRPTGRPNQRRRALPLPLSGLARYHLDPALSPTFAVEESDSFSMENLCPILILAGCGIICTLGTSIKPEDHLRAPFLHLPVAMLP